MNNYLFDTDIQDFFDFALKVAQESGISYITKEALFAAILLYPESAMRKKLIEKKFTNAKIREKAEEILGETPQITAEDFRELNVNGKSYNVDKKIFDLLDELSEYLFTNYNKSVIKVADLIISITEFYADMYEKMMENTNLQLPQTCPENLKADPELLKKITLPRELSSFLTVITNDYAPDSECDICGRDMETQSLIKILMKMTKRNAIFIGEPGVGKTAIVEKLAWMIATGNCPKRFRNSAIVSLDVASVLAGTKYRGEAETKFAALIKYFAEHPDFILFIDEIHTILGAGACREGELDLANALKPILARGEIQVIGATTKAEYDKYFTKDGALARRFNPITVNEPKSCEVYDMLKIKIKNLEEKHHTIISKELVDFIILNAACYHKETNNPDRSLDLIDTTMVISELDNRHEVTKQDVINNFELFQKRFDLKSEDMKKSTACHEAGHCIVHWYSKELTNYTTLALSIMPANDYDGVHSAESDPDITTSSNKEYFIDLIATKLAGRVAEQLHGYPLNAGASSDLEMANKSAYTYVTKFGFCNKINTNRIYFLEDPTKHAMYDEKTISKINKEINKVLKKSEKQAKRILKEHKAEYDALVDALMERHILSNTDIQEIFQQCKQQSKQKKFLSLFSK